MLYALGVIIFVVGMLASIALHEVGHMVPAKRFGVKVTQYMVGFGPTIWSRKRGDTEYGIKAIPAGGYIRMIGMVPPRADGTRSRWPRRMSTAIEDFRAHSRSDVPPGDEDRQFYRLTPGKKIIVMTGGPFMNLVIYVVLTVALLSLIGQKDPTTQVSEISQCVVAANAQVPADGSCPADAPVAPAVGKLQPGDRILAVNGVAVKSWDDIVAWIEPNAGTTITMTVRRAGQSVDVAITPVQNLKYVSATSDATKVAGFVGMSPTFDYQAVPLTQIPGRIVDQLATGLHALSRYPEKIGSLFGTVFDGKPRDPNGAIGVVGLGRIGGEIADSHRLDQMDKFVMLLGILAGTNLLLFLFNLLPLLPLDGGHVAGALVEAARRGRSRLSARRGGASGGHRVQKGLYVDTAQMLPVMYGVASLLIVLTLFVVYADIVNPVKTGF